jgi:hypothetical protein
MIISNMCNVEIIQSKKYQLLHSVVAKVDITTTTGYWLWEKTETVTRQVFKDELSASWIWTDTGEWTPRRDVEQLYAAHEAQAKIKEINQ